ncbi:MAG: ankyrin repeat protein [Myxococcota bacterium]|jgi:ankyrin repeat protein
MPTEQEIITATESFINAIGDYNYKKCQESIAAGADVNGFSGDNRIITVAAMKNEIDIIQLLVKNGADANFENSDGSTALERISHIHKLMTWRIEKETIAELEGRNPQRTLDKKEKASKDLFSAIQDKDLGAVNQAITDGADVNRKHNLYSSSVTPIFMAIFYCNEYSAETSKEIMKALLKAGADANLTSNKGELPLFRAISQNQPELVSLLIEGGTNVNLQDSEGKTPLHKTAEFHLNNERDFSKITSILLKEFADNTIEDNRGKNPADLMDNPELKELLQRDFKKIIAVTARTPALPTELKRSVVKAESPKIPPSSWKIANPGINPNPIRLNRLIQLFKNINCKNFEGRIKLDLV